MTWPLTHASFAGFCLLLTLSTIELVMMLTAARFRHTEVRASAGLIFGQAYLAPVKFLLFIALGATAYHSPLLTGAHGIVIAVLVLLAFICEIWCETGPLRRLRGMLALLTPHDDLAEDNLSRLKYIKSRRSHALLLSLAGIFLAIACFLAGGDIIGLLNAAPNG